MSWHTHSTHTHHIYTSSGGQPGAGRASAVPPPGAAGGGASVPPPGRGTAGPGGAGGSCRRGCLHLGLSISEPGEEERRSGLENCRWMV